MENYGRWPKTKRDLCPYYASDTTRKLSGGDKNKLREATKKMLQNWNKGLETIASAIKHPDNSVPLVLYGDSFVDDDKFEIPEIDIPPGLPLWMRENDGWARRVGKTPLQKKG